MLIDIFNSLLSLSLLLVLAIKYLYINHSASIPIGSLLDSASESDGKSNELKMSIYIVFRFYSVLIIDWKGKQHVVSVQSPVYFS